MEGNIPEITIVIPCRESETAETTLDSLSRQTFKNFETVVVKDQGKGANWARNEGFKSVKSEFVLFSDSDIRWNEYALEMLLYTLKRNPKASYSYGRYEMGGFIIGHHNFDPARLFVGNYISTMSLVRSKDFPGFDENIKRFQDWDLWLTMLKQGKRGVYCNDLIFSTKVRDGISLNGELTTEEAAKIINDKHGLNLPRFNKDFV